MSILVIGVNQRTAPLSLLERFALDGDRLAKYLDALMASDNISEAAIVSTCHRTEAWVVAERFHGALGDVRDVFCDLTYLPPDEFAPHLLTEHDGEAVRHLFEVAAGLRSVVVGEHQILGQVADAWEAARNNGSAGPTLNLLFRHAVEVGKRARNETAIARNVTSVSHAAVVMAGDELGGLGGRSVAVVGAGAMGRGMVGLLADRDIASLSIVNRSAERAEQVAASVGGSGVSLDELAALLVDVDVVFTSTGAPEPVITLEMARAACEARAARGATEPLVLVDIAVPRDVSVEVAGLDGVRVLDMESLEAFAGRGLSERRAEVPAVAAIVDAEVDRFEAARSSRQVAPLITELHAWAEMLRSAELDRHRSRLIDLDPEAADALDAVTRSLVAKLLHTPTVSLKEASGTARGDRIAQSLRDLFDL